MTEYKMDFSSNPKAIKAAKVVRGMWRVGCLLLLIYATLTYLLYQSVEYIENSSDKLINDAYIWVYYISKGCWWLGILLTGSVMYTVIEAVIQSAIGDKKDENLQ